MTTDQLKQKPFREIIKIGHEKLDTEEGESNQDEEESTTFPDMSEQDSESDTSTEDQEESETTETLQVHNDSNDTTYDEHNSSDPEDDKSEENSVNEIQPYTENREQNNVQHNKLLTTNFEV